MRIISLLIALAIIAGCSGTGGSGSADPAAAPHSSSVADPSAAKEKLEEDMAAAALAEVSPEIADQYSGYVHMDAVQLNGQIFQVYYWNKGDFKYTQFAIVKEGKMVFDSKQAGLTLEGGDIWNEEEELWAEAVVQNNRNTFLFTLTDNRPEFASIVVEEIDGEMQVTVNDDFSVNYEDVDQDGSEDLLASPYSGQSPLGPALMGIYQLNGSNYVPDKLLTRQYAQDQLQLSEQEYKNDPSEQTLEQLLNAYLVLGQRSVALSRFAEFYEWAGQFAGDGGYVDEYNGLLRQTETAEQISGWMDKLQPLRTKR
ncbi:hypothetical protein HQN87_01300 [Paenibacillus tritici]|uniref:Uncharacterized protein n=1 Tax=Paenibacillus tritici TaxID=1873425 RepID=A0ABX2DJE2_9BACL|nr:hypothetical protein [Paenibacillus tritici]NQX43951.1 hypothetical protein [Paenibacillus tritici]QUL57514.1 hypothetical protein KDC22_14170 [Paenibacillus tritici]